MKCIICGAELCCDWSGYPPKVSGYSCLICKLKWTIAEHKEDDNWAIRHIRSLETAVKELQDDIKKILKIMQYLSK